MNRFCFAVGTVALFGLAMPSFGADGAATFKAKCAACHAADGSGSTPTGKKLALRPLGSAEVQTQSDDELAAIVTTGKGKMPAYGSKLSEADIKALVAHIRSLAAR